MKFFLVTLVLVVAVAADHHLGGKEEMMKRVAMRIMTTDAKDMASCSSDADCASLTDRPKCCQQFKICKPATSPDLEMEYGSCEADTGCLPMYRCKSNKCHLAGPKACESNSDCLQGITGATYECRENPKTAPGKRCWLQCANDRDCYGCDGDKCRMPTLMQEKLGCCQGTCQKKTACM